MEGLLSLVFFAVLFYLMMRVGCGAHMVHGHGTKQTDKDRHVDPVCGKTIPRSEGYGKMHEGRLFRFCSRDCLDAFESEPDRIAGRRLEATS